MQRGGRWIGVDGGVCGSRHHRQEEEGGRGGQGTRSALQESSASTVGQRLRQGRFLPQVVPRQRQPASAHAAGSLLRACNLGLAQLYAVGRFLLRRLHQGWSGQMLCGADSSLCLLHVPLQPPRTMLGRASCLRYPGLWESWCGCSARGYLWWLEGCGHAVSCTSPNSLLPSSWQERLCCTCRTSRHTFLSYFSLTLS